MTDALSKGDYARLEILNAARELFLTNGFHGTSMRAIARAAGDRAVAGIYNHFPTKEAIFTALIEEANPYDELFTELEAAVADAQTGPEFVRLAFSTIVRVMVPHYSFLQLAQIDLREFEGRTMQHMLQRQVLPRVLVLFERVQALPGIRSIEPVVWLRAMASLIIGFITTDQTIPVGLFGDMSRAEWADRMTDILLYGVAAAPPPGQET